MGYSMDSKAQRVAIYARVSTNDQTTDNQVMQLREIAKHRGWTVTHEFIDQGISGAKGRDKRPQYDAMLKGATRGEFDVIAAWSVDRLGRSLQELVLMFEDLKTLNINLYLQQQGIDTSTIAGKMLYQMCGVFAEFERAMIQERVKSGLARAKAQGKTLGRPRASAELEARILAARAEGKGMLRIAKELGIGTGTVHRVLKAGKDGTQ